MEEKILEVLDTQLDGFICLNQTEFKDDDTHDLFQAIYSLIEKGILRKRNCDGLAFEYNKIINTKLETKKQLQMLYTV